MHKDFEEYTRKRTSKIESSHKHIHQINNYSLPRNLQQIVNRFTLFGWENIVCNSTTAASLYLHHTTRKD